MTEAQKKLKERFLEPETRDGYFIDAKMKAVWKEMLNITEEIVRICDKHGLNYTLAGGTLLGAIRHKGFIPWDDDVDIDMPREDYRKFLALLEKGELKAPYVLQTFVTDPGRMSTFAQIRNPNTTAIDPGWTKYHDCFNMGIGVDIFPIDGIPAGRLDRYVTRTVTFITTGLMLRSKKPRDKSSVSGKLKYLISRSACMIFGRRTIWRIREWAFARNKMSQGRMCGEYSFRMNSSHERWSSSVYDSYLTVPFEYLDLKVPVGYDEVLTAKYGDWRTPTKVNGYHSPLVCDVKRPYKEILIEQFGYSPEWVKDLP